MKLSRCLFSVVFIVGISRNTLGASRTRARANGNDEDGRRSRRPSARRENRQDAGQPDHSDSGRQIASVGSDAQVPAGAQVIDLRTQPCCRGLIDAHTHLTMNPNFGYSMLGFPCRGRR